MQVEFNTFEFDLIGQNMNSYCNIGVVGQNVLQIYES